MRLEKAAVFSVFLCGPGGQRTLPHLAHVPYSVVFPPLGPTTLTMSTATLPKCWQCRELTFGWLERSWQPSELQPPAPPGPSWLHQAATGSSPSAQCRSETATGSVRFPTPQPPTGGREVHRGTNQVAGGWLGGTKQQQLCRHGTRCARCGLGQMRTCPPGPQSNWRDPKVNQNRSTGRWPTLCQQCWRCTPTERILGLGSGTRR